MEYSEILRRLKAMANPEAIAGMARFGIATTNTYGVSVPALRKMAKEAGTDHALAQRLWASGIHEARILAALVDDLSLVTERQMEDWVQVFDSWDVCDLCCSNLFDRTRFAHQKAVEWGQRESEFVKRAGFVLMAALAVHDKAAPDELFLSFLPVIKTESVDERNYVKKAVNWALRQIGKRNANLNRAAVQAAQEIKKIDSRSARWIASDALRELTSVPVQGRLNRTIK
ncbi:MAG: DNA alkylation repair protein [Chloroflexi bacterium]|nr:DNA alkylation repair protein [Chloroflexota bacterium]